MFEKYKRTVQALEKQARPFGGISNPEIYLKRMQYFLDLIGNPEKGLRVVHITGTAGKGSVSRMVQAMLTKSGHTTGLFTSPFVTTTIEKIQVNDEYISPQDFVSIVHFLSPFIAASAQGPYGAPTYFEIIFAIALEYFRRMKCEWVVLEVGLGGRYDATNIVTDPVVTAVTTINYDHTNILGKTLHKIAFDKAGIIKPGSHFFTTERRPRLLQLFKTICEEQHAVFNKVNATPHDFEENNKRLAKAIGEHLVLPSETIVHALDTFKMPARFETVQDAPRIIIDGAHNPVKMESVVSNLNSQVRAKNKMAQIKAMVAFSEDKDVEKMLVTLGKVVNEFWITKYDTSLRNAMEPQKIANILRKVLPSARMHVVEDPILAFKEAAKKLHQDDVVLVTGSFYLAGTIRKLFYSEDWVLKHRSSFPV